MALTEWWELRGGVIEGDVIAVYLRPGAGIEAQQFARAGRRLVCLEVLGEPDESGKVLCRIIQYDSLGFVSLDKLLKEPPVGKKVKLRMKSILKGSPLRLPWDDENERELMVGDIWGDDLNAWLMGREEDKD
jgi:hypothetical protein